MIEYFEKWFWAKSRGIRPLSPEEAEGRHSDGRPYVAVVKDGLETRVISVLNSWVSIKFLNNFGRTDLQYDFRKEEDGSLFLSKAMHLEYKDGRNEPSVSITFLFKPNGDIYIERRDIESGETEEKESVGDVASNKEPYPAFGDYASICRLNR